MNRNSTLRSIAFLLASSVPLCAQSLTTTFNSNAGSSSFWNSPSVSFDLSVTNPAGIVIDTLEVNCPYVGIVGTLELYTTDLGGTSFGYQIAPPPGTWLLRAKATITTAGSDTPVPVLLDKPVSLPPGNYGVYIVHRGCGVRYTNGTQLVYGNADLTLTMGASQGTAFTSALNTPRIANVTINYSAPNDIVDFTADVPSGPSPLTVNFVDRSIVTNGTVVGYEWDFDGDGNVDSTQQNPTAVYSSCGDYSPRLRILTTNGPIERSWTNLVEVDPLVADFTATPETTQPQQPVQFTDTSVGATQWLWDFDNDGVVDSTQQNPTWSYGAGSYSATLTVINGCRSQTVQKRVDSVTDTWTTNYTATNNLIAKQGVAFFDVTVTAADTLVLTAIDVNTIVHRSQTCPITVWLTEGSANGKQQDPTAWREVASGSGISPGGNNPTRITLNRPIVLMPGRTYGFGVHYLDCQPYYNSPGNSTMSHPDFTVDFHGVNTATTPFSTTPTTRQWNGSLHYTKVSSWPVGAITMYGFGCPGSLGVPGMVPVGDERPKLGTSWSVEVTNLARGAGVLIFGFSDATSSFGALPFDLSVIGMTGCQLHTSLDVTAGLSSPTSTATFGLAFPVDPNLNGLQMYMQAFCIDPGVNALNSTMSDALTVVTAID